MSKPGMSLSDTSQKSSSAHNTSSRLPTTRSPSSRSLVKQNSTKAPLLKQSSKQLINSAQGFDMLKPTAGIFQEEETEFQDIVFVTVQEGDAKVLKKVVRKHRQYVAYTEPGSEFTPLHVATREGFFDCVKVLVEAGADVNVVDYTERSPLHNAVIGGHFECVRYLLENGADVHARGMDTEPPLIYAVAKGYFKIMKFLITHGASVHWNGKFGGSPLHYAADFGHYDCIKYLIDSGVDINSVDVDGQTALFRACVCGHAECVKILIKKGADSSIKDRNGRTALHQAVKGGFLDCVKHISADATTVLNVQDKNGFTPLHVAAAEGLIDIIKYLILLDHKLDVNIKDAKNCRFLDLLTKDLRQQIIIESTFSFNSLASNNNELWFYIIQIEGVEAIYKKTEQYIQKYPSLAHAVDNTGRAGLDVATLPTKIAMLLKTECPYAFLAQNNFDMWFYLLKVKDVPEIDRRVFEYVQLYQELIDAKDSNGNTSLAEATLENRIAIILASKKPIMEIFDRNYEAWFQFIQVTGIEDVEMIVAAYVEEFPELAYCKDADGRVAIEVAAPVNRDAMRSTFLWHGRFEVLGKFPEYCSDSCFIFRATDETETDATGKPEQVVLKLFTSKAKLMSLWSIVRKGFSDQYVLPMYDSFPPPGYDLSHFPDYIQLPEMKKLLFGDTIMKKSDAERLFCVVMPYADRNLSVAMKRDRVICTESMDLVIHIFTQVVESVQHMHSKGYIHGNLVPSNICRHDSRWLLMDLQSMVALGRSALKNAKYSSAYLPPEAIHVDSDGVAMVRSNIGTLGEVREGARFEYLKAHPSLDIWALGCILFQMVTPDSSTLFLADLDDHISSVSRDPTDNLLSLAHWTMATKADKLARVLDPVARNLLEMVLQKDPAKRPSLSRILSHPFLSKKTSTRLPGQPPEFDVYLSYRSECDMAYAKQLYTLLTERGVTVWWDKLCLPPSADWVNSYYTGLANASMFCCLVSRNSINNAKIPKFNFGLLHVDSELDSVLLEYRTALEFIDAGLIDTAMPVLIGDPVAIAASTKLDDPTQFKMHSKFFPQSCLPRAPMIAIKSVEEAHRCALQAEALGESLIASNSVADILHGILSYSGVTIEGDCDVAMINAAERVVAGLSQIKQKRVMNVLETANIVVPEAVHRSLSGSSTSAAPTPAGGDLSWQGSIQKPLGSLVKSDSLPGLLKAENSGAGWGVRSDHGGSQMSESKGFVQDGIASVDLATIGSMANTIREQEREILLLRDQLNVMSVELVRATSHDTVAASSNSKLDSNNNNCNNHISPHYSSSSNNNNNSADCVVDLHNPVPTRAAEHAAFIENLNNEVKSLHDEVANLKSLLEVRDQEISALKAPTHKEMTLLKDQLLLLSALEKEMKAMTEKNKSLRKQAAKDVKMLRDQLSIQIEENNRLKLDLEAAGKMLSKSAPSLKPIEKTKIVHGNVDTGTSEGPETGTDRGSH